MTRKTPRSRKGKTTSSKSDETGFKLGFRSGLEVSVAGQIADKTSSPVCYEAHKLKYTPPQKVRTYTPDFILPNGIVIETKGRFLTADRQKHKHIKTEHPDLEVRFVFSNPQQRISKTSSTTYAMWCEQYGFKYAAKLIPNTWFNERLTPSQVDATKRVLGWSKPK